MYAEGLGVPQDDAKAFKWYLQPAKIGRVAAQYNLGLMKSVKWYRRAAEQGHATAQSYLGEVLTAKGDFGLCMYGASSFRLTVQTGYPTCASSCLFVRVVAQQSPTYHCLSEIDVRCNQR
jgi:TPR repeat protein